MASPAVALQKRNGAWQAKTPAEQEGWIRQRPASRQSSWRTWRRRPIRTTTISVSPMRKYFSGEIKVAKDLMQI
jgi:hypothetical protein